MKNEFDNKTKEYVIGRPTYPEEVVNIIKELGIEKQSTIADIGAGTGLLTHLLCRLGCNVLAVEPNIDMQTDSDFAKEYINTVHKYKVKTTAGISDFDPHKEKMHFFGQDYTIEYYDYWHSVTEEGFIGGALSLSYTPSILDSNYEEFIQELRNLFFHYQQDGKVTFHYKTEVCICEFL
ncbi:hypothetical protein PB01_14605 [Psychrobacillus glaciei]|uniref:Class I SAM-dependent methyltransferase n=1 Tax=Psychrobacillus glaciei TaxID=2283160 RepID=A0A5J6SR26_9BACI|nr:hypothetical protein [Psychrobacillus glaciei]QFF99953.1 hypothetical protein PB01_14605 [Psychrobacillus glaciei]